MGSGHVQRRVRLSERTVICMLTLDLSNVLGAGNVFPFHAGSMLLTGLISQVLIVFLLHIVTLCVIFSYVSLCSLSVVGSAPQ